MIIEIRKGLKSVGWFWYFIAAMFIVPQLINGIRMLRAKLDSVATVNGISIRYKEFMRAKHAYESYMKNLASIGLANFARPKSDTQIVADCAKDIMIDGVAENVGIEVSGQKLAEEISKGLARHSLNKDGALDYRRYASSVMASAGMSVADYEKTQMEGLRAQALQELIGACSYSPKYTSNYYDGIKSRDKKFKILEMPLGKFIDGIKKEEISSEQLELFYKENISSYMTTPERTITYTFMDKSIFQEMAVPEDFELEDFYDRHMTEKFSKPEKFSVNYVWMDAASDEDKQKAKEALSALAQEAKASGKKLGQLAGKKSGMNTESKEDFAVAKGVLPYALEAQIQEKREVGAITEVVEATGKVLVAQVDAHQPFSIKPFDQVKQDVFEAVSQIKVNDLIRDEVEGMIREFRETEDGKAILDREADRLSLKKKSLSFKLDQAPKGELETELFRLAFNKNVYEGHLGYSSRKDGLVVFVVTEVTPPEAIAFDKVESQVKKDFLEKRARSTQEEFAEKVRQKIIGDQDLSQDLEQWKLKQTISEWVSRGEKDIRGFSFGPKVIDELMTMDRPGQVYKHWADDSYFLVSISEQKDSGKASEEEKKHDFDDFRSASDTWDGFIACLKKDAKIVHNKGILGDLIPEF